METKENNIFTYTYSATEKQSPTEKKLSKEEMEEIEKIRQEYLRDNKGKKSNE